jgi:AmiR/NasT family two-component response regulator
MTEPQSIRVLIVDDDALVLETVQRVLERLRYTIVGRAMNGTQALEMVQTLAPAPDIVLMDIQMPGMDGVTAARQIQEQCPTPVVILTAYDTPELVDQAQTAGVMAYLIKPPNTANLGAIIPVALARFREIQTLKRLNVELQDALDQVKQLQGMLPICAHCKKIRDDDGYWHQIESYIRDHSEAVFSHSICPDCFRELYPEYVEDEPPLG